MPKGERAANALLPCFTTEWRMNFGVMAYVKQASDREQACAGSQCMLLVDGASWPALGAATDEAIGWPPVVSLWPETALPFCNS